MLCINQESVPTDTNTGIRWAEVKTSGVSCRYQDLLSGIMYFENNPFKKRSS